ncbi:MutT 8-oxo-dGTP pyrophosphohydrolase-like protein [Trypanosoma grayi]|uniref:MutT 8-oxo-dGTP pyrophosphohydrolase-like protein n=1 Tax=Trypanosoma grayi TaxID=71804 RepID=UPI0004F4BD82|nr:MutT 8-oxo-dGTP pyrophosphohydrolase-like protein [Trypanosoma grayi]KEG12205.1 MutT 8-oxo-dGTP pyrophosphohydrolase-like protein [Trypanosoma grayi]
MSVAAGAHFLPRSVVEWTALVRSSLQLRLDQLHLPEHFFYKELGNGRRFSHLQTCAVPRHTRENAVLVLLSPPAGGMENGFREMCITLTKRTDKLRRHGGQISFPGGTVDAGEMPAAAAQRETVEEVGIDALAYDIIGSLHPISTVDGGSCVHPYVAVAASSVAPTCASPDEVASIHYLHLSRLLLDSQHTHCRLIKLRSLTSQNPAHFPCFFASASQTVPSGNVCPTENVPGMPEDEGLAPMLPEDYPGELVWGITAFVLCELLVRLSTALEQMHPKEANANEMLRGSSVVARDPQAPMGKL